MSRTDTREEVRLTAREYEQLRRATGTHREELLVRLCGEAGLRAAEITRLRPGDVTTRDDGGSTRYFLTVRGDDEREAYLPERVAHDFRQYVRSNGVDTDEPVVDVTPRRVQMLVREVGERAAERAGRPTLAAVTPSTLRRFFARRLLVEHGVDPRIVMAIGGWETVDGLLPGREAPSREEIAAAFECVAGEDDTGEPGRLGAAVATLDRVGEALSTAGSRADIEDAVSRTLIEGDTYDVAWIMEEERRRDRVVARAHAGADPDRFEGTDDTRLVRQALQTGRVLVAPDRPRQAATEQGMLAAIPLVHGETTYGVLVVGAGDSTAFDDAERTLLSDLGRRVGLAITATERKQLLFGDTVVALTFQYDAADGVLADLSASLSCAVDLEGVVAAEGHSLLCFVAVDGAPAEEVLEWAADSSGVGDARLLRSYDGGGLVEVAIEHGATPAQVCLAWLVERDHVVPIPKGRGDHVEENLAAPDRVPGVDGTAAHRQAGVGAAGGLPRGLLRVAPRVDRRGTRRVDGRLLPDAAQPPPAGPAETPLGAVRRGRRRPRRVAAVGARETPWLARAVDG
ncbi:bacterio-opsin activator [Halobacteriales archaeon SW_10_68_16]|nr:MAG: bacterio-opsin activator [Halobacteriales archaeon SW_10_68_16]